VKSWWKEIVASGIKLKDGSEYKADIVISNGDVAFTYRYFTASFEKEEVYKWPY
jgi:hypothetical protein